MELRHEQIVAMAIAVIAEEINEDVKNLRVLSFKELHKSRLDQYLEEYQIDYKKFQLGDEIA